MSAGRVLWTPSLERIAAAHLTAYQDWLRAERGVDTATYDELWRWSVDHVDPFWESIWDHFEVSASTPYTQVLRARAMPGAVWFPGARLNYAEHALRRRDDHPAIEFENESGAASTLTYAELHDQVAAVAAWLRAVGVGPEDRVAGFLPNLPETIVAFLAAASVGATWSVCSPDFGVRSVVDRFAQIEPKVLVTVDGYTYGGKPFDRRDAVAELRASLPTLEQVVVIPNLAETTIEGTVAWASLLASPAPELSFEQVPFDHPLWILYSSGTTGLPKGIVHGHGGMLLEQLRSHALQLDVGGDDRFFWFGSTGWAVWNVVVGALLRGSTLLLFDGNPGHPDLTRLWRFAAERRATFFGISPPFLQACLKAGLRPGASHDLSALRGFGSTGAPLAPEVFEWIYQDVNEDVLLASLSGGTDICSAFVGPSPILAVRSGEMQCRWLGCKVESWDPDGNPVADEVGELVVLEPLPAMPTQLWGDTDGSRYRSSYFEPWAGIWRHGDWLRVTPSGGAVISGRSDSTLKRAGVRMGTAEIYSIVEAVDGVADSLVVDTSQAGADGKLILFVVPVAGDLDDALKAEVLAALRENLSPRHAPDEMHQLAVVPRTINGKKLEVPVKKILLGADIDTAVSRGALADPTALDVIAVIADNRLKSEQGETP